MKRIAGEAKRQGLGFDPDREGANHVISSLDGVIIPIPHHREVNEPTTEGTTASARARLGKRLVATMSTYTVLVSRDGKFW